MKSELSASANGCHTREENGVPWQSTSPGPEPARPHAISRPCHSKRSPSSTLPETTRSREGGYEPFVDRTVSCPRVGCA